MTHLRFAGQPFEAQREVLHGIKDADLFRFDPETSRAAKS